MATIVRRVWKSGLGTSWAVVYNINGKQKWDTFRDQKAAEARRDQLNSPPVTVGAALPPDVTFSDYAAHWLKHLDVKESTRSNYDWAVRLYLVPKIGTVEVRAISRSTIKQLVWELGRTRSVRACPGKEYLSRKSLLDIYIALSSCLGEACYDEIISANPALDSDRIKRRLLPSQAELQVRVRPLSPEGYCALIATARRFSPDYAALFEFLYYTGTRVGEALALRWSDVDFERRQVHIQRAMSERTLSVPKNGRTRSLPMCDSLIAVLRAQERRVQEAWSRRGLTQPALVFPTEKGNPRDRNHARKKFIRLLKRAGVTQHHTIHDLRHTFATRLCEHGAPLTFVQHWMGHSTPQLTIGTYARFMKPRGFEHIKMLEEGVPPLEN